MDNNHLKYSLTEEAAIEAYNSWRFNCGPASLCALIGMTPEQIRPHLGNFEKKGYTDPDLMVKIIGNLGLSLEKLHESYDTPDKIMFHSFSAVKWPNFGLVRVQWSGRWTEPKSAAWARHRHTHWIGTMCQHGVRLVFDHNALSTGGWMPPRIWASKLVPWLLKSCEPESTGMWWPTHSFEIGFPG